MYKYRIEVSTKALTVTKGKLLIPISLCPGVQKVSGGQKFITPRVVQKRKLKKFEHKPSHYDFHQLQERARDKKKGYKIYPNLKFD